jgi:hypothetical protein
MPALPCCYPHRQSPPNHPQAWSTPLHAKQQHTIPTGDVTIQMHMPLLLVESQLFLAYTPSEVTWQLLLLTGLSESAQLVPSGLAVSAGATFPVRHLQLHSSWGTAQLGSSAHVHPHNMSRPEMQDTTHRRAVLSLLLLLFVLQEGHRSHMGAGGWRGALSTAHTRQPHIPHTQTGAPRIWGVWQLPIWCLGGGAGLVCRSCCRSFCMSVYPVHSVWRVPASAVKCIHL